MALRQTLPASFAPISLGRTFPRLDLGKLFSLLALWQQRQQLAQMSDHQLEDIGLTRAEATTESKRPVWDAPSAFTARP